MVVAPIPSHESARLAALHCYQILDTPPEPAFDELAQLAAYVCRAPIAVISFVDFTRQWFKSVIGLPYTGSPRSMAFCAHTILGPDLFIVEEADADERFQDHPWVIEPPTVRFYAGVPLLSSDGHAIGSLAVMDVVPRTLTPEQRAGMRTLAKQVMAQCELRERRSGQSRDEYAVIQDLVREIAEPVFVTDRQGCVTFVNSEAELLVGFSSDELLGQSLHDRLHPHDSGGRCVCSERCPLAKFHQKSLPVRHQKNEVVCKDGRSLRVGWSAVPLNVEGGSAGGMVVVCNTTNKRRDEELFNLVASRTAAYTGEMFVSALVETLAQGAGVEYALCARALPNGGRARTLAVWGCGRHHPNFEYDLAGTPCDTVFEKTFCHYPTGVKALFPEDLMLQQMGIESYMALPLFGAAGQAIGWLAIMGVGPIEDPDWAESLLRVAVGRAGSELERELVQQQLGESEERYALALRRTSDGIWDWNVTTGEAVLSPRWKALMGFAEHELSDHESSFFDRVHPDDLARVRAATQDHLERRVPYDVECRLRHKDGTYRWIQSRAQALWDENDRAYRMVGATTDITERKQSEEALRASEERFRAAYRNATVGMTIADVSGQLLEVNQALCTILGYSEEELLTRTLQSLTYPEDLGKHLERVQKLLAGTIPCDGIEKRYIKKDGEVIWAQVGLSVIRDEAGQPTHILAMVQDITERKRAEEALLLAKYSVDHATEAIYWVGPGAELLDVNESACAMLGYSKNEFLRMTVHDINPYFQTETWPAFWEQTRQRGRASFESYHRAKDGRLIPIEVNVNFLIYHGREWHCAFVRDITERQRAESVLRQSEERFHFAIEATNDGIWDWNIQTGAVYFSPQWIRLLGYAPEEVIPSTEFFFAILHPEDVTRTTEVLQAHLDGRTPVKELELRLRQKSGEYRWYFDRGKVVARHRDGHPLRMVGTITDITERKQAEQDRAQALNNLQTIMETVPDVIFALNQEGCLVKWNARMEVVTGYPSEELQGKPALEMVPPEEAAQTAMAIQRAFETGYAELEGHLLTKDGRSIPYHWTGAPFTDLQGRVIGITGVGRDVTERKQTESALRLTRFSIQQAVDAVFWIDAQARILDVNDAACRALGYTREELLSKTVPDIDPNFPPEAWPAHWEELKARKSFSFETGHRRKDGTVIQTETTVNFLIHEGREYNCAFMRDITDRKRAEDALRMTRFSVERVSDAVFWIDAGAHILDVNEAACLSLQYSREELLSMHLFDIDPHVTESNWARLWQEKLEQRSLTFESSQIRRDGTAFPVEVTCNHLRFGRQEFCCAMVRNISERKDAEGRLKFSEERFRLVAEATNDILWDWDLVTQEHWWSPNAQEKFGYDPNEEPSIAAWTDRLHADDRDRVMALIDRALASDVRAVTAEYQFRLADGSYGNFYDRGQIVRDSSGRPIRMVGAMIDITFSKRAYVSLEEAYRRLQSMSRELQTVESNERRRLSRELHDEVGQLLTALKFDLEATRQALNEKEAVAIVRAQERTLRALQATDELFARLRRVVRALRPSVLEELGLKDALEALVSDVQSRSDLVCSVSVEGETVRGLAASAIESSLYRMAQELVTNVVRHAQAATLSVSLEVDLRHWVLTVQDDGIGFNPNAESINGMGVRGVRERAEILGGHVDVRSVSGAGTTITVWIPVSPIAMPGTGLSGA